MIIGQEKVYTVKNTLKRFSIYVLALLLLIGVIAGASSSLLYSETTSSQGNITVIENYPVHNINKSKDYSTIQSAIDDARSGDEIHVDSGIYYETVNVTERLILRGIGMPVVNAKGSGSAITISNNGVILEGFTATGSSPYPKAGIKVTSNNNMLISNNVSNNDYGIYLVDSNNNILTGNNVYSNIYDGIYLERSNNNNLSDNKASNNEFGICLYHSSNNNFIDNIANSNNQEGINLYDSHNNKLTGNNVNSNFNYGIYLLDSINNNLTGNNVNSNEDRGVYLENSTDNMLYNNIISDNGFGIDLFSSSNNTLTGNNISNNNDYGISVSGSNQNWIYNNIFNNSIEFFDSGESDTNTWNTTKTTGTNIIGGPNFGGNFWAKPDGTGFSQNCIDGNGDDICDSNQELNSNNIDLLPLTLPGARGIVNAALSPNSSLSGSTSAFMNFTVNDPSNATAWYNITFHEGFDLSNANVNLKINGSDDPVNWTNSTSAHYVNISSNDFGITANGNMVQYINLSNVIVSSIRGNYLINVTTNNGITAPLNYTINEYDVNLSSISPLSQNSSTSTNASYIFILTNNGTMPDSYNLTYTNPDGAKVIGFDIANIFYYLDSNASKEFTLNVTNTSSGTFRVNVIATSTNDSGKVSCVNTTTTVHSYEVQLTADSTTATTFAGSNATYMLVLTNTGTAADSYNLTVENANSASTAALDISGNITLGSGASQTLILNVTNTSSGTFRVNVTARSNNDPTKTGYINTTTIVPIIINITNPANGSTTKDSYVNVTVTLDADGLAHYLNWESVNKTMIPDTPQASGTIFYLNMTDRLSGNYSFKVYANDTAGNTNVSETRTITVDRTIRTNLSLDPDTGNVSQTVIIPSIDGNASLTIFNGTNATLDGEPIINITVDLLNNVNSTFVEQLGSDKLIGENLSLGPGGAHFHPDIQIRFNYTDSMLLAAGISASDLRVKFFNTSTNTWDTQTPYTLNETDKYIIANVSHFSTFALVGTTTNPTQTITNGGDGSSDVGVVTPEPSDNIAWSETYKKDIVPYKPAVYTFKLTEHGIYEITFTSKEVETNIALRVEALKGPTKIKGISAPPGIVYKNLNIWAGSKRIKEGLIKFKVENTWISNNTVEKGDMLLIKWDGIQWVQLVTQETTKDDIYSLYEANTDSFGSFAVTALKGAVVPVATSVAQDTEAGTPENPAGTENPTPVPTKRTPGFEGIIAVSIISLIAVDLRRYLK
jgi:PGF-pre-PGF domain-containing protein